ncbi:MAG: hypothetical protein KatS3mg061_3417 [Dehalococcoidia bacterium]|nr:MAG: hypothetical protein KatS3mg061_3417 [Dehalococcoidia bacterium]
MARGAFGSFWLLRAVGRRLPPAPLGWGDVKLAGLVGLVCGLPLTPLALLLGTAAGAGAALALLLAGWPRRAFFSLRPRPGERRPRGPRLVGAGRRGVSPTDQPAAQLQRSFDSSGS